MTAWRGEGSPRWVIRARSLTLPAAFAASVVAACSSSDTGASPGACSSVELLVAASDYASSVVCGAPCCEISAATSGVDLGKDPQLTTSNGRVFFIARDNELVFELDAKTGRPSARYNVHGDGPGPAANPHDAAAAPDESIWVPLYGRAQIAILRGGKVDGTIDLSKYDADGNPQAESIRIVSVDGVPKAFVALERLDDADKLTSKQPSQMLRIDVATRNIETAIELAGRNPFNPMEEAGGALYLAEPGNFDRVDEPFAGIERFDTKTGATKLLVTEKDLGGSVTQLAITEGCGAAIVAGPVPNVNPTAVVTFDPVSGAVSKPASAALLGPTPGYDLQGLAWRGNHLYVGDRRAGQQGFRVHVFERDPGTCNLHKVDRALDLPQRPVALRAAQ